MLLAEESRLRPGTLMRHVALQLRIVGQEHAAKATLAQLAQDLVAANHVGDRQRLIAVGVRSIAARVQVVVARQVHRTGRTWILRCAGWRSWPSLLPRPPGRRGIAGGTRRSARPRQHPGADQPLRR